MAAAKKDAEESSEEEKKESVNPLTRSFSKRGAGAGPGGALKRTGAVRGQTGTAGKLRRKGSIFDLIPDQEETDDQGGKKKKTSGKSAGKSAGKAAAKRFSKATASAKTMSAAGKGPGPGGAVSVPRDGLVSLIQLAHGQILHLCFNFYCSRSSSCISQW